ncbi:TIGR02611 family protein [Plantactinospora siamensis]|uniref:TIGR02611 family protein n=1 Tax=Plantactinospora siamensis TaxID=555372 RepID=A0ABV6NYM4_9ACTN
MATKPSSLEQSERPITSGTKAGGESTEWGSQVSDDRAGADPRTGESAPVTPSGRAEAAAPDGSTARRWRRTRTALDLIRANPTGRILLKIVVGLAGAVVVAVGAVLVPLPGPGWLIVIAGLAIWAIEFHWARRLLTFTRARVRAWTRWVGGRSWPTRLLLGAVSLAFVGVVVLISLRYSLGIDLLAIARDALAAR